AHSLSWRRNDASIAAEARLDGLYVIRTSVPATTMTAERAVGAYKALARVERAFRSLKTVDLEIRPVYHWLSTRVRAAVFLCMLAYPCGVPHAPAPGAAAVRRARPRGGRGGADVDRGAGRAVTGGAAQGSPPADRRRPAAAQLPQPAARPRHPRAEQGHGADQSELHLQPADKNDTAAGPCLRAARWEPGPVASTDPPRRFVKAYQ